MKISRAQGLFLLSTFIAAAPGFAAHHSKGRSPLAELPARPACYAQVSALVNTWENNPKWKREANSGVGTRVYSSPTSTFGVWVAVEFPETSDGMVTAYRMTSNETTRVTWDSAKCSAMVQMVARENTASSDYTDVDLKKIIDTKKKGVIFSWSPYMPLSNVAYPELKKAAEKRGMDVVMVMDPYASEDLGKDQIKSNGWSKEASRKIASTELLNRGTPNHYPSVVVYSDGVLSQKLFPGAMNEGQYGHVLDEELKVIGKGNQGE